MASTVPPNSRASSMARFSPPSDLAEPSTATTMCSNGRAVEVLDDQGVGLGEAADDALGDGPETVSLTAAMPMAPMTTRSKSLSLTSSTMTLKFLPSRERRTSSTSYFSQSGSRTSM
jgi:hypothetical protein